MHNGECMIKIYSLCIFFIFYHNYGKMVRYGKMVGNGKLVVTGRAGKRWEMPKIPISV